MRACEDSLKRLATDVIDVYFIHGFDSGTPVEETLRTLDDLVRSGKVRYIGCSNFAAWQLMKALSISEKHSLERYVVYQGYYSLVGRDYEQELMPLFQDQGVGLMVWSALGWSRLTGRIKRGQPLPEGRIKAGGAAHGPEIDDALLYDVLDVLEVLSAETGKSVPQLAINWLLHRPTVSSVIIGARNEQQLIENLGATGWKLTAEQMERLDKVSTQKLTYPHWVGAR
jgi:aryl-alcohol dehydrogenase-like predicted oxidoreductase